MEHLERQARTNLILKDLSNEVLSRLMVHMQEREIQAKEILHQAGEPIRYIFFPLTAVLSMLMPTSDGATVELTTVGREGVTGTSAILNGTMTEHSGALARAITVIPGTVIRMEIDPFKIAAGSNLSVARCLHRYLGQLLTDLALSVTCNRLHALGHRCARWLLTAMEKSNTSEIPVTQEMLAGMLGASRQSIVQVLSDFEMNRWIRCGRGAIRIEMPAALGLSACECYGISKKRALSWEAPLSWGES